MKFLSDVMRSPVISFYNVFRIEYQAFVMF